MRAQAADDAFQSFAAKEDRPQREDWMLQPPKQEDWSTRVDPTKLRNRKFNTGKGSKAPNQQSSVDSRLWTETPEQKRQRLEDEVMGITQRATDDQTASKKKKKNPDRDEATVRKIKEYTVRLVVFAYLSYEADSHQEKNRGQSLANERKKTTPHEEEDDPSKRAFDKEKDIRGGTKIGHAKRQEMMTRAADFGSRFSGGGFL